VVVGGSRFRGCLRKSRDVGEEQQGVVMLGSAMRQLFSERPKELCQRGSRAMEKREGAQ